jgi:hypothetical protein
MTNEQKPKTPSAKDREKAERLAEQLRANLRRRKEQARAMKGKG